MRVIGTAGHVDHGKSTLVRRLTGIDPDRLAEEKARALTIDLGFAWLEQSDRETIGVVDVPGHRDFIENMLAGVGAVDAVLLVIAADEGVMPQTREHLAILDLLGIQNGLIAMTKIDMVDDPDWVELVEMDIREVLNGTGLQDAAIIPVSAHTGAGVDNLLDHLNQLLEDIPDQPDINQPRMPVDRVFTMSGFGTVVTGTLLGGALRTGDEVEFQPSNRRGRIRGLQSYQRQVDVVYPGSRVAVNVTGVDRDEIARGDVLAIPDLVKPTQLFDAHFQHLSDADKPLKHNAEVKVFSGAAEAIGYIRLLANEQMMPGEEGWIQVRLQSALPISRGDRFIIRYPSPPLTIGGGLVVDAHPTSRWKRFREEVIDRLQTQLAGKPGERVAQAAEGSEPVKAVNLQKLTGYPDTEFQSALDEALNDGLLQEMAPGQYMATVSVLHLLREISKIITDFHKNTPLRAGISREELRSRLQIKGATLNILLDMQEEFVVESTLVRHRAHQVKFNAEQQAKIEQFMKDMSQSPFAPPSMSDASAMVGVDVLRALIELGRIVQVKPEVIFTREAYDEMVTGTLALIDRDGKVDAGTLRDRFNTSRKYAIGLLEYLDDKGITRRDGDFRVHGRG